MPHPIAYLGPNGTFSHLLVRKRFPRETSLVPQPDITGIFEFIAQDPARRAVVPVENTSGGTIYGTVDLLIESAGASFVTESLALVIRMALIGHRDRPVRRVYSHFVQIHNHRAWLASHLPKAEIIPVASTALAAELAAKEKSAAALSAPGAAEIYGLDVLGSPPDRSADNITHFYVLTGTRAKLRDPATARTAVAVSFGNQPGSLFRFLEPFARANLNINRIISRPHPGRSDRVMFFMEIDGAPGLPAYDRTISKATARTDTFHDLGSFPAHRKFRS